MKTRFAEFDDLALVSVMAFEGFDELHKENNAYDPDENKIQKMVVRAWSQAPCILLLENEKIIGFAGLKTVEIPYSNQVVLSEYLFYIQPEHRSYKAAHALSKAAQDVSENFKIPLNFMHLTFGKSVEVKERFLKRWGYQVKSLLCTYGDK